MSERERWIVYPLLFFALGAALRDKYTKNVLTDSLHATSISCEELLVIDSENEQRIVAELRSVAPDTSGEQSTNRFGRLILRDNEGKQLCGATNEMLQVRQIACDQLQVVEPGTNIVLAFLGSEPYAQAINGLVKRFGILMLNNQRYQMLWGLPPSAQPAGSRVAPPTKDAPKNSEPDEASK